MHISSSSDFNGLCANGEGCLCADAMCFWMNLPERTDPAGVVFEIQEGITGTEPGFFELLPTVRRLILPDSMQHMPLTAEEKQILRKNGCIISGSFGRLAEALAKELGLRFLHADIPLASGGDYDTTGTYVVTLRFFPDRSPRIRIESFSQGSSAGSSLGGTEWIDLRPDFHETLTQEALAAFCPGSCRPQIRKNAALHRFLSTAKKKGGYDFPADPLHFLP